VTLEIIKRAPRGVRRGPPLLFVHGAFVGAWCWDEYFLPYFAEAGYEVHALSLRGHGKSAVERAFDLTSLDDYVADVIHAASSIDGAPVMIGHSMGAIVVQRAARQCGARGMVLVAPVPPHGLSTSMFTLALRDPPLFLAINALQLGDGADGGSLRRVRDYLFSQTTTEADARRHLVRMQRESQRALLDLAWPQHLWIQPSRGIPAMVVGAGRDAFFPAAMVEEAARFHAVTPAIFPDMAHAMMLESDWASVADAIASWLTAQEAPRST
jgi:pimeloyl-ACP methyl ester carboxylesterase